MFLDWASFLCIGDAPYIGHKIMAGHWCFHFFFFGTSSLKQPEGGNYYYAKRLPKHRPSWFGQIIVKLYRLAFRRNFFMVTL